MLAKYNYNDGTQVYLTDVPMKSYCTTIFRSSKLYLSTHIIVFQLFETGNFRVQKPSLSKLCRWVEKLLLKWVLFAWEWKIHFHIWYNALSLVLKQRLEGIKKMRCTPARVTQNDFLFAFNNDTCCRVTRTSFYFPVEKGMPKNVSVYLCTKPPRLSWKRGCLCTWTRANEMK